MQIDEDEIALRRARKLVREFLNHFAPGENILMSFRRSLLDRDWPVREMVPGFAEAIEGGSRDEAVVSAWYLWQFIMSSGDSVAIHIDCGSALVEGLSGQRELAERTCMLLSIPPIPNVVRVPLRRLVHAADPRLAVLAAAALVGVGEGGDDDESEYAAGLFRPALRGDDAISAGAAGGALLKIGDDGLAELCECLPGMKAESQFMVLFFAFLLGRKSERLYDAAAEILNDTMNDSVVRGLAAMTLGSISAGTDTAVSLLLRALDSPDCWDVVHGTLQGLRESGQTPDEAALRLLALLQSENRDSRKIAVKGILYMGTLASFAIPNLIERLRIEPEPEISIELIKALTTFGEEAVPALTEVVLGKDDRMAQVAVVAISSMGDQAPFVLAGLLRRTQTEQTRTLIVMSMLTNGRNMASALPILAEIAKESEDDDLVMHAVAAISMSGPAAVVTVPTLIECIAERTDDDPMVKELESALWVIRERAVPLLQQAANRSDGDRRRRLDASVMRMKAVLISHLGRLAELRSDKLIAMFIDVGGILEEVGPTSWPIIAKLLRKRDDQGLLTSGYTGISASNLRIRMKDLGAMIPWVRGPLTTHGDGRKGELNPEGRAFLKEARAYWKKRSTLHQRYVM